MSQRITPIYQAAPVVPPFSVLTWLRPVGLMRVSDPAAQATDLWPLAGGWIGFSQLDVVMRLEGGLSVWRKTPKDLLEAAADKAAAESWLERLSAPRSDFASLAMDRPHLMGVVNATPDSFSDGGRHLAASDAISAGRQMAHDGARILDIGGESTRPGAEPVAADEEKRRILPVIEQLVSDGHIVSADTRHTDVMAAALDSGAHIINDVGGFADEGAPVLMGRAYAANPDKAFAITMHMQGAPQTMQANPSYDFAPLDIYDWLAERVTTLEAAGLPRTHIAIDPGFGFGKTVQDNIDLIAWASLFHGLGVPVLYGVSRKSTIAKVMQSETGIAPEAADRLAGSLSLGVRVIDQGIQMLRIHDVPETRQALTLFNR